MFNASLFNKTEFDSISSGDINILVSTIAITSAIFSSAFTNVNLPKFYNRFKKNLFSGLTDFFGSGGHNYKVALLNSGYTFDPDHNIFSQISTLYEISGPGYSAGGQALTNFSVTQDDSNNFGVLTLDNVSWTGATIIARYAVIYDNTLINKDLILCIDFVTNQIVTNATFALNFSSLGLINIV